MAPSRWLTAGNVFGLVAARDRLAARAEPDEHVGEQRAPGDRQDQHVPVDRDEHAVEVGRRVEGGFRRAGGFGVGLRLGARLWPVL